MKPLLLWCAVFLGVYASVSAAYHVLLSQHPRRVVVAVDASFPMQAVWSQVPDALAALQARRYTLFSLMTDKASLHTWQPHLQLGSIQPYAPRALAHLLDRNRYPNIALADQVYVITNATDYAALPADIPWRLVSLQPLAP
jgi:hypothetical protein